MEFIALALALLIGLLLGLLGGGGSILAVPVLVYAVGLDPKLAIALSLGVVGTASLAGALPYMRAGSLDLRTALLFAAGSAVGALGGAALSRLVDGRAQLLVFAVVMLVVAISMLRPARRQGGAGGAEEVREERRGRTIVLSVVRGAGVGVLTGFVGVGGGFLIVPALVLLAEMPVKRAVGTSLLVIAINSAAGMTGYLLQPAIRERIGATSVAGLPLVVYLAIFTAVAIAGVGLGVRLGRSLDARTIRRAFAVALLCMAAFIIAQNGGRIW